MSVEGSGRVGFVGFGFEIGLVCVECEAKHVTIADRQPPSLAIVVLYVFHSNSSAADCTAALLA